MNLKAVTFSLAALAALATTGCSKGQQCTPAASECAGERAVLLCPSDGTAWATYPCAAWETCSAGKCKAVDGIDVACTPGTAKCINDRVLSVCVAANTAPSILSCNENETCKDGACAPNAACTAGATECVSTSLMRTCSADGKSWVASACSPLEACSATTGSCARRTDVFCTSADSTCVDGVPFVCKKDGTGFDTTACAANTHCVGDGRCQGNSTTGCVVGSTCSGDTVVSCSNDGKTTTYTQCAVGHSCVADPATRSASCKQVVCGAGTRRCGNPADASADPGAFVSTCKPDGSGWAVARCETGSVCNGGICVFDCLPGTTACSDNSIVTCSAQGKWDRASVTRCGENEVCAQLPDGRTRCDDYLCLYMLNGTCTDSQHFVACKDGDLQPIVFCPNGCMDDVCLAPCIEGETQCSGDTIVTCTKEGSWPTAATENCGVPAGTLSPQVCIQLSELPGAHKATCGDPECAVISQTCTPDGKLRKCTNGLLGAAEDCPTGTTCRSAIVGCWQDDCAADETLCIDVGTNTSSLGYRTCENGAWSETYESCGQTSLKADKVCQDSFSDTGKRVALCSDPAACTPGAVRCTRDGKVETCQQDRTWAPPTDCAYGTCKLGACTADCIPGEKVCGVPVADMYGQDAWSKTGLCSPAARMPDWSTIPTCDPGSYCRLDASGKALGCVECVGTRTSTGYVDTRCGGDFTFGYKVEFCGPSNTWLSGASMTLSCNNQYCFSALPYTPAYCGMPPPK
ncbi:MAG: hypothetical protein QM765_47160 [Myxococcales bacterium]